MLISSLRKFAIVLPALLLLACSASNTRKIQSTTEAPSNTPLHPEEVELIEESDRFHQQMVKKGLIYRNNDISLYIDTLVDKLLSEKVKATTNLSFFVTRDPSVNAFALPNGNIYLNVGLVNKVETEAQLVFVMAHEAAHVVQRHSLKERLNRQSTVVGAHFADFLLGGIGLSYIAAISDLASYSRELETEADEKALTYISKTDYNLESAVGTFNQLKEVKHQKAGTSIWASHPDNVARLAHANKFIETKAFSAEGPIVTSPTFDEIKGSLTEATVKMRLRLRQYQLAEETCQVSIDIHGESAMLSAYIADSYRLRATNPNAAAKEYAWLYDKNLKDVKAEFTAKKDDHLQKAIDLYQQAVALDETYMRAWRGLGLASIDAGDSENGKEYLNRYLQDKNIKDRRYIESILKGKTK